MEQVLQDAGRGENQNRVLSSRAPAQDVGVHLAALSVSSTVAPCLALEHVWKLVQAPSALSVRAFTEMLSPGAAVSVSSNLVIGEHRKIQFSFLPAFFIFRLCIVFSPR